MFDSGISALELIENLKQEVDIAIPISNFSYVMWLNSLEQLLYSEIIAEQREYLFDVGTLKGNIALGDIEVPDRESAVRFEDIYAVYADDIQLIHSTLTSGMIFPNTFYKDGESLRFNIQSEAENIRVVYFVRPAPKTVDGNGNINDGNVMIPSEFIDLVNARLRGEAYKVANEDEIAAKWINDYNVLLESFKAWVNGKASNFGM